MGVVVPDGTAGVAAGIRIDARFQSEGMDVVGYSLHSLRETHGVGVHPSGGVAFAEEAVVYIDIGIAGFLQPGLHQGVRLFFYQLVADVHPVGVPGAPAHQGRGNLPFNVLRLCEGRE